MGEKRKGGSRGPAERAKGRRVKARSGTPKHFPGKKRDRGIKNKQRKQDAGRVVSLSGRRQTRAAGVPKKRVSPGPARRAVGVGRLRMVALVLAVTGLLLGGRAVHIGVANDDQHGALAAAETMVPVASGGKIRGSIESADGRELARSLQAAQIIATPYQVEDPAGAAGVLAGMLGPETGKSEGEILASLKARGADGQPAGYSLVASDVPPDVAGRIEDKAIPGISTAPDTVRLYTEGPLASQLVGYQGEFGEAFGGVEDRYDKQLARGEDVAVTLDTAVQQELEDALVKTVEKHEAKSAVGLMMRVEDGAIVALANAPGYDNNEYDKAPVEAQRDRVITDPYEPGSTFKAFTVASALEAGAVTTDTTYVVPDHMAVADRIIHDSRPHETKVMAPADVLRESSNVGTIQIAQDLGGRRLHGAIRRFGFGEPTGVDLWGENAGIVPAHEDWSGSSIGNIPIGQGLAVTPLQLVAGYAALANGGTRVTPHVAENAGSATPGPRVISERTSDIVGGMLQGVVEDGSGHLAQIPGYTVAGKTGTSQKVDPKTGTYTTEYVSSFIGYAPATDPEFVMLIAVDEPQTTYWGELTSAPTFQDVMGFALGYYNVPPDDPHQAEETRP